MARVLSSVHAFRMCPVDYIVCWNSVLYAYKLNVTLPARLHVSTSRLAVPMHVILCGVRLWLL